MKPWESKENSDIAFKYDKEKETEFFEEYKLYHENK